ncbi:hypothetical protein PSQ90_09680 [Devosia rhodophyticola]|uniref:Uncharacterized protein n=1 Tax=Devosia rhodophyticola TaxID=3026423 RepID=A0ABY7YTG2_9HYPH|nr:hypothetical protein [Devosia rhodophyticola]WDR04601.1 hypothetical protein PSQ90_09680 [Devosia rhodophyticola]
MTEINRIKRSNLTPGLPMVIEAQRPRPSLKRSETTAAFVSQLLIGRRQSEQKLMRSANPAVTAYTNGAQIAVLRMPQGYRKMVVV